MSVSCVNDGVCWGCCLVLIVVFVDECVYVDDNIWWGVLLFGDPLKTGSKQEGSMMDREPWSDCSVLTQGSVMFNEELISPYAFFLPEVDRRYCNWTPLHVRVRGA